MSGPTPPPFSEDSSVKREFSSPPDQLQEFVADVLSTEVFQDHLREDLAGQTDAGPSANKADIEIQDASPPHDASGGQRARSLPLQQNLDSFHEATTLQQADEPEAPQQDPSEISQPAELQQDDVPPHGSFSMNDHFDDEGAASEHSSRSFVIPDTSNSEDTPGEASHYLGSSAKELKPRRKFPKQRENGMRRGGDCLRTNDKDHLTSGNS